jgi:hypothetical protein
LKWTVDCHTRDKQILIKREGEKGAKIKE